MIFLMFITISVLFMFRVKFKGWWWVLLLTAHTVFSGHSFIEGGVI